MVAAIEKAAAWMLRVHKRDLVIIALLLLNFVFTAQYVSRATAASAKVIQLCQVANQQHAEQVNLWGYLVTISKPPPGETPAQAQARLAATRAFLTYVHRVFAPRNCTAQLGGRP